jgi:hypothetical protein
VLLARLAFADHRFDDAITLGMDGYRRFHSTGAALQAAEAMLARGASEGGAIYTADYGEAQALALATDAEGGISAPATQRLSRYAQRVWHATRSRHGELPNQLRTETPRATRAKTPRSCERLACWQQNSA